MPNSSQESDEVIFIVEFRLDMLVLGLASAIDGSAIDDLVGDKPTSDLDRVRRGILEDIKDENRLDSSLGLDENLLDTEFERDGIGVSSNVVNFDELAFFSAVFEISRDGSGHGVEGPSVTFS